MDNSVDSWKTLMEKVMLLIQDPRSDVSQCAVRTFGSLMSSNFTQIPRPVFHFLIQEACPKLLTSFKLDNQAVLGDFSLTLQEFGHYAATFWDSFCEEPTFISEFIPLLIQKQTDFVLHCENLEIVTKSFQFYEGMFQCQSLIKESEDQLRQSISTINDYFMKLDDQNSIVFSGFGRLMGNILVSLKTRQVTDTLPLWFPIIQKIVETCKSVQFVHITPSRVLDAMPTLFPMSEETTFKLIPFLIGFTKYEDSPALPEYISSLLAKIWTKGLQDEFRYRFVMECKPLFKLPCAEPLMKAILESRIGASDDCADELLSCYSLMSSTCKSLDKSANAALVVMIDKMTKDAQKTFIKNSKDDFHVLSLVWKTFFNYDSDKFNQDIYDNCFDATLDAIAELLNDPRDVLPILEFLSACSVPERTVNEKSTNKWFLLRLMPSLAGLITHESKDVRLCVQSLMVSVSSFLCSIC